MINKKQSGGGAIYNHATETWKDDGSYDKNSRNAANAEANLLNRYMQFNDNFKRQILENTVQRGPHTAFNWKNAAKRKYIVDLSQLDDISPGTTKYKELLKSINDIHQSLYDDLDSSLFYRERSTASRPAHARNSGHAAQEENIEYLKDAILWHPTNVIGIKCPKCNINVTEKGARGRGGIICDECLEEEAEKKHSSGGNFKRKTKKRKTKKRKTKKRKTKKRKTKKRKTKK